jgi:formate dehydrogenase gamma subunit
VSTSARRLWRFDRVERVVHWCNATLFLILVFTGASLYVAQLSTLVGNRHTVKTVHVYAGLLLPIPLLLGLVIPAGRRLRSDISRFNRWTEADRHWWAGRTRRQAQIGKFNPGQKLNAIFIGASIVLMLVTGAIMRWFGPFPDNIRTGATFVHDWTFIMLVVVIIGHVMFAFTDFDSLRSMIRGWVPEEWARRERPAWWAESIAGSVGSEGADARGDVEAGGDERVGEAPVRTREMPVGD